MKLFKDEKIKRVTSPEQLNDYIKVTGVHVWIILVALILMLIAFCLWGVLGRLETKVACQVTVTEEHAIVDTPIEADENMLINVHGRKAYIDNVEIHTDGCTVSAEVKDVDDGVYNGYIITKTVAPVYYLFN